MVVCGAVAAVKRCKIYHVQAWVVLCFLQFAYLLQNSAHQSDEEQVDCSGIVYVDRSPYHVEQRLLLHAYRMYISVVLGMHVIVLHRVSVCLEFPYHAAESSQSLAV